MDAQVKHQAVYRVTVPQPGAMPTQAEGGAEETENWQIKLGKILFYVAEPIDARWMRVLFSRPSELRWFVTNLQNTIRRLL